LFSSDFLSHQTKNEVHHIQTWYKPDDPNLEMFGYGESAGKIKENFG